MNTQQSQQSLLKFRPVLTLDQIKHIISLTSEDDAVSDFGQLEPTPVPNSAHQINQSIRRVLVPLLAKIEVGAINPAYKLSEIHAAKLADVAERKRYESGEMSPAEESDYEARVLGV